MRKSILVSVFANLITATTVRGRLRNMSCGIDGTSMTYVYEGMSRIEYYPWLGILYYPVGRKRFTTAVVLVTRQTVIATATEIDSMPKDQFRARSRVILGHNCSGPPIRVRDYTYHPEFRRNSYSALALIQLDVDEVRQDLRPICPPPSYFIDPKIYAMAVSSDCKKSQIQIYEMNYVDPKECRTFYRRSGLDVNSIWPAHTACARAKSGGKCVWKSGTVLAVRQGIRWRLLGFGVLGPGCEDPARFVDYGLYHNWVKTSISRIGRTAITRVAADYVILRRSLSKMQRFGKCDKEEKRVELYSDSTNVTGRHLAYKRMRLNVTLLANVEYSCVQFKVIQDGAAHEYKPFIRLRRWCAGAYAICSGFQLINIDFYVEIFFIHKVQFKMRAYGKQAEVIDTERAMVYANMGRTRPNLNLSDVDINKLRDKNDFHWD